MLSPPPYDPLELPRFSDPRWEGEGGAGGPEEEEEEEEEEDEGSARSFERSRIKALADEREAVQKKTFTKWVNSHLAGGSHLGDLYSDLRDGRLLLRLLEGLSGETLPRPTRGRMRIHCLENVEKALRFLREQRVHLENVGSHDIVDGNPRLTLGLVWTIILRFQIQDISVETGDTRERKSAKDALLAWCQMKTAGYPNVNVQNFTTSWRDGLAFCALIHRHRPELLDVASLRGANALHNLQSAFAVAERELGVTRLLDPEDVAVEQPDERSVLTYVAALYHHFSRMKALAVEGKRVGKVRDGHGVDRRTQGDGRGTGEHRDGHTDGWLEREQEEEGVDRWTDGRPARWTAEPREAEGLAGRYEAQAAELLGWIQRSLLLLTDRRLPRGIPGLQGQLQAFSAYRTTEKPPAGCGVCRKGFGGPQVGFWDRPKGFGIPPVGFGASPGSQGGFWGPSVDFGVSCCRFEDKGSLEVLLFSLRSRLRANNQRQFVPREGTHSADINRAWERLEKAEHGRELALRSELLRQQHLEQLAARFHRKAALRESWLGDNQRLVAQDNFGGSLGGVEAALRKHEAIESDIAAYGSRVRAVTAVAAELEAERYHDMGGIATRRDHVVSLWEALRAQVAARRERLRAHLELQRLLRDLEHLMGWMEEMEVRLQSRDFGQHLSQVDDLLQIHALVEGDVAAQAERVRSVGAAAERFLGEGGGYRPCPPEQLRARVAALELRYRGLSALSAQRRLRLERSRRLWKFLWDAGEEEAWMREQERLLRCPELGRDLPGALRMLSQLEAIRGALGGRAGPLEQLLERGRELLAQGAPDGAAGSPAGSTGGSAGPMEATPGSAGSAAGSTGSAKPAESTAGAAAKSPGPPGPPGPPNASTGRAAGPVESPPASTEGPSPSASRAAERPDGSPQPPEGCPEPTPGCPDPAAAVSRRIRELESLWAALPALARARERRLRAAAGRFQLDAEAAEAEAWLVATARRVAGPELGHDERSAGMLERRLRELQDEIRRRGPALAALREQALPADAADVPDVVPGLAERLAELERRHRELEARAELRRLELRDALGLFAARSEADACALWVGEREQWLLSMEIPERIEDLEVVQQRFETLEPELAALAARVASVGRVTQELQGSGDRNRESARETWEQLRDRWERFRALCERKKAALTAALNIQNFRLECHETRGWMREKTAAIEATRALGRDLAGITALQGKLSGMGRDLDAIQGKLRELRAEGEKLQGEQPERAPEIREGLAGLEAEWDALRRCHRSREESLGQARRLQGFLRDLAALQAWLSRTRAAAGSEDVPASLAEAEGSLRQHESLRTEISHYGADYRSARSAGREVTRGQTDPQSLSLLQRLEALDTDWEELGQVWEKRQRLLAQAVAFHVFLRDAKQVEGTLGKQEHTLAHTEMPGTVPGAEAAVRRLEEFLAALDTGAERVRALTDTGRKLLDEGGVHAEKVRETVESVESRHQKIRESAQELLGRLRDNWELQKFLQDGQELTLWLNEKLPVARDVSYEGTRDLQGKWQKHQAFAAELAANRGWLEALEKDGEQLARARPALAGQVTAPRQELRALWAQVEAAAAAKGRGLAEAARAESCAQACAGLRSWLAGVRAQLRSGHCGQDLTSVGVLLTRHQLLETQAALREQEVGALRAQAGGLSPGHPRSAGVQEQVRDLEQQFRELREPLRERGRSLAAARELHQFRRDLEDELLWVQERQALAVSTDHGKDLPSVQLLLQKNETLQKELQGRERRVTELLERGVPGAGVPGSGVPGGVPGGVPALREAWRELRAQAARRQRRLEAALAAQRFLRDAAAAEAWLGERELHMLAQDKAKDEPGAQAMLSRHLGLEQELRDYGGTVELLAEQGRAMAASGHPDGWGQPGDTPGTAGMVPVSRDTPVPCPSARCPLRSLRPLSPCALSVLCCPLSPPSERLRARAAQVQRLYAGLCHLAGERRATLQGHHRLCQLRRDLDDLEQWISEREVVAASRELGQDFEHVTLLRDKFREFSRDTGGLGQERVDAANAAAAALIAGGHPERAAVAQWQAGLNEAWAELLELVATRAQELAAAHDLQRFRRDARQVLAQLRDKARQVPEELGRDLRAAEGLERQHRAFEHDVQALSAQVTAVQEAAGRLAAAYAGPRAEELRAQEGAVATAWAELRGRCQRRRRLLGDTVEQFRFLRAARDLRLWMDGMQLQLQARERPRDVTAAELLIQQHQGLRAELEAREGSFGACVAAATALLQRGHHDADKLSQELAELQERRRDIGEHWQDKLEWLQTVLEVLVFGRDAATAEAWLASREPLARAPELGSSLAEAETLLKRHQSFQKAAAAWDERFAALSRLTTLEEKEQRRRQEEEEEAARKLQPPEPPPAQDEVGGTPPVVPPESRDGGGGGEVQRAPTPQSRPAEAPALNGIRPDSATGQVPNGAQEGGPGPGGVAATLPPRAPPPPETLEGGLCRKQELEAPGKRATNRSWQSLYCVLRGGALSVFKDARGAGAGVPYHGEPPPLRGARCHPATAYRKRKHVFRLGLSDGKEFLFQAKDEADMALWLRGIEAAAGAALGPGGAPGGLGGPWGSPKGMSRALSLPPVPPPAEGAPRPREPKEREKRFSFFKKNK
ncbi:LOW QUALITY PROTEIN: spectrin beta chain, non-erythrocytic 2 [Cyanocitta cristata]